MPGSSRRSTTAQRARSPHDLRAVQAAASRHRPGRDPGVDRVAGRGRRAARARPAPSSCSTSCSSARGSSTSACRRTIQTRYINTISPEQEPPFPGDEADGAADPAPRSAGTRWRWSRAPTTRFPGIGGHLSTYASAASLYEVGFNHFFRGKDGRGRRRPGLLPGPRRARASTPAPSSRGASTSEQLDHFRREAVPAGALLLPAPAADARVLGVPDRLDGARPDQRRSTRRASTATCSARGIADTAGVAGLGLRRRRRDGRARGARRAARWPRARGSTT